MQQVVQVPTLNDSPSDFQNLFSLWKQVALYDEDVLFDFTHCRFLRPNAVAFLGGLARFLQCRSRSVNFDWDSVLDEAVFNNLCQNGFADYFGYPSPGLSEHSIPYREDLELDPNGIMDYLEDYWLGRGWVQVSQRLKDAIIGRMWEIYNNAFEHSESSIGVYSCGQHLVQEDDLILSVVDFGQGIPAKVRNFLRSDSRADQLTAAGCLQWAFAAGNSTKVGEPGGLGLDLLKEFVRLNQGKLEVYSNEGYAVIDQSGELYKNNSDSFEGTIVHITLRCDENLYSFMDEFEETS